VLSVARHSISHSKTDADLPDKDIPLILRDFFVCGIIYKVLYGRICLHYKKGFGARIRFLLGYLVLSL
jgi:hypothetical protein